MPNPTPSPALAVDKIKLALALARNVLNLGITVHGWRVAHDELSEAESQFTALLAAAEEGRKDRKAPLPEDVLNRLGEFGAQRRSGDVMIQLQIGKFYLGYVTLDWLRYYTDLENPDPKTAARTPDPAREEQTDGTR